MVTMTQRQYRAERQGLRQAAVRIVRGSGRPYWAADGWTTEQLVERLMGRGWHVVRVGEDSTMMGRPNTATQLYVGDEIVAVE